MKPNLFILGAGKCGTTSLHIILGQHPDIHASAIKEPTFFCWPYQVVRSPIEYFKLFDSPARHRMESSHAYLSNPETAPVLRALLPDARFVVILRHPKARAFSLYRHMRRALTSNAGRPLEEIPSFRLALRAEPERFRSKDFREHCPQYFWNFMYCRSSIFDEQLARYYALFDRKQFHVLTLAELARAPTQAIGGIMEFLDLDPAPVETFAFPPANSGGAHEPHAAEAEKIMETAFDGLTARVDRLVGRALDWSL
jgi:hypothetical protein